LFTDLPQNKSFEDKFLLGIYKSNDLIGIIDIIRDYPTISEWTIGLLLLEPKERGRGLDTAIHEALDKWAKSFGAKRFRIGVIDYNDRAFKFWLNLGYVKEKEINVDIVSKNQLVNVMVKEL